MARRNHGERVGVVRRSLRVGVSRRAAPRAEFEPRPSRGDAAGYTVVCSDDGTTETTPTCADVFYQCAT